MSRDLSQRLSCGVTAGGGIAMMVMPPPNSANARDCATGRRVAVVASRSRIGDLPKTLTGIV